MSMRGNGVSSCTDCGGTIEPERRGGLYGICRSCDTGPALCVEGCGTEAVEDGRCSKCHAAIAGAEA